MYKNKYQEMLIHRYDEDLVLKYMKQINYRLSKEEVSFSTKEGETLRGYFYFYSNYDKTNLVIFAHGLGSGHLSYMSEIAYLCAKGYRVLCYDNTGCNLSTGSSIRGLSESLNCLDAVLNYFESKQEFSNLAIHLIGHSWGGFAVQNILAYHHSIKSVCSISGFVSIKRVLSDLVGKNTKYKRAFYKFEKKVNSHLAKMNSLKVLKKTKVKVLIIHSLDDDMVSYKNNTRYLFMHLKNPNVNFLLTDGKAHYPNYTLEGVKLLKQSFGEYKRLIKEGKIKTKEEKELFLSRINFELITQQDETIWQHILQNMKC